MYVIRILSSFQMVIIQYWNTYNIEKLNTSNESKRILKGQSKMDNPQKLATCVHNAKKNTTQYVLDTTAQANTNNGNKT